MKSKLKRLTPKQSSIRQQAKKSVSKKTKTSSVKASLMRREMDRQLFQGVDFIFPANNLYRRKNDFEKMKELSDVQLVAMVQKGNSAAYQELFGRYQRKLFVYVYHLVGNKEEVEDLLQNVFSKTYKNIANFDLERKFSSWIYRIAHNESVNFLKRKSKKQFISWEEIVTTKDKLETQSEEKLPEEKWILKELTDEVDTAMDNLPEKYKQVLTMRYFSEYSYETIAKMLGKPVNTIGTLISRAKKKMIEEINALESQNKGR